MLVTHNGARWLPTALAGVLGQDRPVQRIVPVDTGSEDDSPRLLAETFGEPAVLHLARRTGFGAAVDAAVRATPALRQDQLPWQLSGHYDPDTGDWTPQPGYGYPQAAPAAGPGTDPAAGPEGAGHAEPDDHLAQLAAIGRTADRDAPRSVSLDPGAGPVEWLWLLHDDCSPEPDALRRLLRVAETGTAAHAGVADPNAGRTAVVGPKLRGWYDARQLLEVGSSIAPSGRRWTGLERREQDQGQHDGVRRVLAVSSAGMLVRRDVWESLGGFDRALPLMRDDADFGWRANAAGHRVLVAPDAIVRHAEAAARERRKIHAAHGGPHQVDKAGAAFTLLANTRAAALPWTLLRLVLGTLLRTLGYLVAKVPRQALDEVLGLASVLLRPYRVLAARRRRGRVRRIPHQKLRGLFPKPGATLTFAVEQLIGDLGRRGTESTSNSARHSAVETGPTSDDADFLDEGERFARLKRLSRRPGILLLVGLLLFSLLAFRNLLSGTLQGGALLPAPGGAGQLWSTFTAFWHPVGTGAAGAAPPWIAVPAALGSVLLGNASLAVTLMMVLAVPLAGFSAYLAARPLVTDRWVRIWLGAGYALAPAVTGGLAGGRLGMTVLAVLLPPLARSAVSAVGWTALGYRGRGEATATVDTPARHTGSWRSAWLAGLLLAVVTAFTPAVWPLALLLLAGTTVWLTLADRGDIASTDATLRGPRRALPLRVLALLAVPLVLDAPWSLKLLAHPARFLAQAGAADPAPRQHDLLGPLLSPGGAGAPAGWIYAGVLLAALAALLRADRLRAALACWTAAAVAAVLGLWAQHANVAGGPAWSGATVLVCTAALLAAAAIGAQDARTLVSGSAFGWRQPAALLTAALAALGPVAALGWWAWQGVDGGSSPLAARQAAQVPPFVAAESATTDQPRTLMLRATQGAGAESIDFTVVRGSGITLGDADVLAAQGANRSLTEAVRDLAAGTGGDQPQELADFAVRYIVARPPVDPALARTLDTTPGLTRLSQEGGTLLWRNDRVAARLTLRQAGDPAATKVLPAGRIGVDTRVPSGTGDRTVRLADRADGHWRATLDGKALTPAASSTDWAQTWKVPDSGGRLRVDYATPLGHRLWLGAQGLLVLVALVLALPGRNPELSDDTAAAEAEAAAAAAAAASGPPTGRRARRLAAQGATTSDAPAVPSPTPSPEAEYGTFSEDPYGYYQQPHPQPQEQEQPPAPYGDYATYPDYTPHPQPEPPGDGS
ncbi:hypothetical protein BIV57_05115 [Mangrovactinospora gilvigrisea]|uniref:Glycosyltransferase 2-like domain-containing protein n=1 Tax=Mangrovactinospora gilvigrisea TaxID=1428644 RepID=A0A1J7BIY1_9ACTN|nr:hypothetical protein BIV57_05115 [Mangrovactinospora gilvigrisea]